MRIFRWLIIIYILSSALTHQAQSWTAWLYHPEDGLLLHLDSEGIVLDTRTIPTDDGYRTPYKVLFSHDGQLFVTVAQADTSFRQRLTLYDVDTEDTLFVYELPLLDDMPFNADDQLILSETAFSHDDKQLAFVSTIGGIGWTIHIADIRSGEIIHNLSFDHQEVIQQPFLTSASIPQLALFQDNTIGFYINQSTHNPSLQGHSYAWFLISDVVREMIAFPNATYDVLDTGEIIYPLPDNRFLSDNDTIPKIRQHHNVLVVYFSGDQSRYPTISRPELDLLEPRFIQGGERILLSAWEDIIRTRWLIYDRNGREIRNFPAAGYDVTATTDGFVYLTELNDNTILVNVNTRDFDSAGDTVWVDEGEWQIVSVSTGLSNDLQPFAQLENAQTPPPFITTNNPQPTHFPTPQPLVYIGREMQIQVLDDGYINLRDNPSTDGAVQALLENGRYVDIIDGPVESGAYIWWKVRLSGREGWLVEAVEGTQVLIPRKLVEENNESDIEPNENN